MMRVLVQTAVEGTQGQILFDFTTYCTVCLVSLCFILFSLINPVASSLGPQSWLHCLFRNDLP